MGGKEAASFPHCTTAGADRKGWGRLRTLPLTRHPEACSWSLRFHMAGLAEEGSSGAQLTWRGRSGVGGCTQEAAGQPPQAAQERRPDTEHVGTCDPGAKSGPGEPRMQHTWELQVPGPSLIVSGEAALRFGVCRAP